MPKHIMVFNDTEEILDLFNQVLTHLGYSVTLRSVGDQDLRVVLETCPDLVIVDCPPLAREEQGWQLVQKLRMSRETERVPVILASTNLQAIEQTEGRLITRGVHVLPKPFTLDELEHVVHDALGDPREGTG